MSVLHSYVKSITPYNIMYTYDWYFALIFVVVVVVVVSSGASRVNDKRKKLKVKNIHRDAHGVSVVHNNKNNKITYVRPSLVYVAADTACLPPPKADSCTGYHYRGKNTSNKQMHTVRGTYYSDSVSRNLYKI